MTNNEFCVARTKNNGCTRLKSKKCTGSPCVFAQTKEQAKEAQIKTYKYLSEKSEEEQRDIAIKYYGGKMPWRKSGGKRGR